ncbi:MAG: hypothetical protein ATN31_00805 [Candidatus Epulonipiscioides saccharophilum]|nr:MAG: hypothetical protein ATN31_00805 [Epulopiscium sp. AS2M-Bin001]
MTEKIATNNVDSKRQELKQLIKNFQAINEHIDINIFPTMYNINLEIVLGTRKCSALSSFLDSY